MSGTPSLFFQNFCKRALLTSASNAKHMTCNPKVLLESPKMVNSQKWLGEVAKGSLSSGSKSLPRVFCTIRNPFSTGATPFWTGATPFSLPGLERPFAPSPNHFWEFTIFGVSNSGFIHPYGRYGNAFKTRESISTIAILWPVKAIFEERAATVEVDSFLSPEGYVCGNSAESSRKISDKLLQKCIDLVMGLFRGAVFHHGGVPENCPLALMGRFPSLMGRLTTLTGRFPECLNGPFSLLKIAWKTALS